MKPFRCPECRKVTSRDQDFCVRCGETLTIVCGECKENWRYYQGYRFCPVCGSEAPHSQEESEHKKEK